MQWFIGILIGIIILSTLFGILRGTKEQFFKTLSTLVSIGVAVVIAVLLQVWANGFQLLENLGSIFHPDILVSIKDSISFLLPNNQIVEFLGKILFLNSYSALLVLVIYLIVKKLVGILFALVFKLGKVEKLIRKGRDKQKASSYIFGGILGLINGILILTVIYSPVIELLAAL